MFYWNPIGNISSFPQWVFNETLMIVKLFIHPTEKYHKEWEYTYTFLLKFKRWFCSNILPLTMTWWRSRNIQKFHNLLFPHFCVLNVKIKMSLFGLSFVLFILLLVWKVLKFFVDISKLEYITWSPNFEGLSLQNFQFNIRKRI